MNQIIISICSTYLLLKNSSEQQKKKSNRAMVLHSDTAKQIKLMRSCRVPGAPPLPRATFRFLISLA